jgi:hypothetical protein
MTVTFLSPISPNDLKRQSLVFSYLHVDIKSKDGANHDVQLYADISAGENLPSLCGCKLIDLSFQNGYLEIVVQLLSGIMVWLETFLTIECIDKINYSSPKSATKLNGGTGTGRLITRKIWPISLARILPFEGSSQIMDLFKILGTPIIELSTTVGPFLGLQLI